MLFRSLYDTPFALNCENYTIENILSPSPPTPLPFSYLNCFNSPVTYSINPGDQYTFCGISGSFDLIGIQIISSGSCYATHVGNIFYAQGLAVITNQAYTASFPEAEQCSLYSLQGVDRAPETIFQYVTCSDTTYITESILVGPETRCINNNYPITIISGPGSYTYSSPCGVTSSITTSISFQNEHIIYENEVRCIVKESEFNLSYNPTLVTGSYASGSLRGFATSASFEPYVTTIGLYNDENQLLAVAKLGKPIVISADTDMTFIVKYDT